MKKIAGLVKDILLAIGENPEREGLLRTPQRVEKAYEFLTRGYHQDVEKILNNAVFEQECNEMVVVRDIEFYSMCEHHMLPFFGKAHVAYLPKDKIVGLSKIPRIVDIYAKRLQVQERLTRQVADTLEEVLDPYGVAVIMEAKHMCMLMRGVEKQNSFVTTSTLLGQFKKERATRMELLSLLNSKAYT